MNGDIRLKYCPICECDTDQLQGCFKIKEINGELFHLDISQSDSLKKVSAGFKNFVVDKKDGVMNGDTPSEYLETKKRGFDFEEMFSPQVRSLKCIKCLHLIKISKLP